MDPITTGILTNLLASGLLYGHSTAQQKWRGMIRESEFHTELDDLETEFYRSLRDAIAECEIERETNELTDIVADWDGVVERLEAEYSEGALDNTDHLLFKNEADGIDQLAHSIADVQGFELEKTPQLQQALTEAVAEAYDRACQRFSDRVAGTEIAEVFKLETGMELQSAVNELDARLTAIQRDLRHDTAALRDAGFIRLDALYFERHDPITPEVAWRTGFDFAEIAADYPLPRERPATTTDDRRVIAQEVYERLVGGEDLVVKGEGGTGKSTVCKRVAYRWYAATDHGTVLYRESARTTAFETPGTLIEAIRAAEEDLLVVVEDVPSGEATAIFEVLAECEGMSDVTFLFDARAGAWEDATDVGGHASLEHQRQQLGIVEMPALDECECERAIVHYETLTGEESGRTSAQLYEEVRSAELGGPLVLAYQLTGPAVGADHPVSALHADVHRAYTAVEEWADDPEFSQLVATMVNVLNAAGLPVNAAFVHAVANESAEHSLVERTLGFLEGTMLEQSDDGLRMPHQLWSALYLQHMLDVAGARLARHRFEQCVGSLFRLFDDEEARSTVQHWIHPLPESFVAITETPEETAGRFVRHLADIGTIRPKLGAIYGTPKMWSVTLPAPCPIAAHSQWWIIRGRTHIERGAFDVAEAAFEQANRLLDTEERDKTERLQQHARVHSNLGLVAWKQGEFDTAESYFEESIALKRKLGDRHGEAKSLNNLGLVARKRGEMEAAESYYKESLALKRELGDRHGEAKSLNNLGLVARKRGKSEVAETYYRESLALKRELGDRHGEAKSLNNLGLVARKRGKSEVAETYYRESLALKRELGDRHGEAKSLNNLGVVARKHGELEAAESYYRESLALKRELGDRHGEAKSLNNLGVVARKRGELEAAESYFKKSLALKRELGDRHGEAYSLNNLGVVARRRGELEAAETYFEESLALRRELGDRHGEAYSLNNLGVVARKRGELEAAESYLKKSLVLCREIDDRYEEAECLTNLGDVADDRNDLKRAEEYYAGSLSILREHEVIGDALNRFADLIEIRAERGTDDQVIKWCEEAIDFAEQAGQDTEREQFQDWLRELTSPDE